MRLVQLPASRATSLRSSALSLLLRAASLRSSAVPAPSPADALGLAKQLYDMPQPPKLVAYITGGGAQLAPWLLATPGASKSVLELQVPYSRHSLAQLLGSEPARFCSAEVARGLASEAFKRARELHDGDSAAECFVGLGCTAALRSEPPKRGEHRCYLAVRTSAGMHEFTLALAKGWRSRLLEDAVVSRCALLAVAHASDLPTAPGPGDVDFWRLDADDEPEAEAAAEGGVRLIADEQLEHRFIALD